MTVSACEPFPALPNRLHDSQGDDVINQPRWAGQFASFDPATEKLFDAAIASLKTVGAVVVDPVDLPNLGKYDDEGTVLQYEFSDAKLIGYAYAYELATHARKPPRFLAHIEAPD